MTRIRNIFLIASVLALACIECGFAAAQASSKPKDGVFLALERADDIAIKTGIGYSIKRGAHPDIQFLKENLDLSELKDDGTLFIYSHGTPGQLTTVRTDEEFAELATVLTGKTGLKPSFKGTVEFVACSTGSKVPLSKVRAEEFLLGLKARGVNEKLAQWIASPLEKAGQITKGNIETITKYLIEKKSISKDGQENAAKVGQLAEYVIAFSKQTEVQARSVVEKFAQHLRAKERTGITIVGATGPTMTFTIDPQPIQAVVADGVPGEWVGELRGWITTLFHGARLNPVQVRVLSAAGVDLKLSGRFPVKNTPGGVARWKEFAPIVSEKNLDLVAGSVVALGEMAEEEALNFALLSKVDPEALGLPQFKGLHKLFKSPEVSFQRVVT